MRRLVPLFVSIVVGGAALAGTAGAQLPRDYYVAVPATRPTRATMVTRATLWSLRGDALVAGRAADRDAVMCELVARSAGPLLAFSAGGRAYDAGALATCNAHARPDAARKDGRAPD